MTQATQIRGDQHFIDNVVFKKGVTIPSGTITDDDIEAGAGIDASKLDHQYMLTHTQATGTDVVAQTELVHIAWGDGELIGVFIVCDAVPTGSNPTSDKTVTVDVRKSTGGGASTTLLELPIEIDSSDTNLVPIVATLISDPSYSADDVISIVVTVAGSTGTQAKGLCVLVYVREAA